MRIIETARKRILNGNGVNPFFLDLNGVTIRLKTDQGFGAGSVGLADFDPSGKVYTAYDQTMWEAVTDANYDPLVDFTSVCTTLVNDMINSFIDGTFNQTISHFDTSNVTSMRLMFRGASLFNQPINNWDVSKVLDMTSMFRLANNFNQPLNNWDVSSVINMTSMLRDNLFNQPLNNWNVSNVLNMDFMFNSASNFDQDISNWCVEQIASTPTGFDVGTPVSWTASEKPNWGDPC